MYMHDHSTVIISVVSELINNIPGISRYKQVTGLLNTLLYKKYWILQTSFLKQNELQSIVGYVLSIIYLSCVYLYIWFSRLFIKLQ